MKIKSLYHFMMGRRKLYQFYANITFSTPRECLKIHGDIFRSEEEVQKKGLNCDFELLEFDVFKLGDYQEKAWKMKDLAEKEINRRDLLQEGIDALREGERGQALEKIEESVKIDIFIPEIEELVDEFSNKLDENLKNELKEIFVKQYNEKFAKRRYERQPELMRIQREEAGVKRIKELFS